MELRMSSKLKRRLLWSAGFQNYVIAMYVSILNPTYVLSQKVWLIAPHGEHTIVYYRFDWIWK